jgi:anion-transporting  ArsA/GET3 family ATPase
MQESPGRARWDLIVVDAPATGHGVTFLSAPRVVVSALRTGPLRRQAAKVEDLIEDPVRTELLPVALAEELPVRETEELIDSVQRAVGIRVGRVVVNGVLPRPFPVGLDDLPAPAPPARRCAAGRAPAAAHPLAACAAHLRARWELHEALRRARSNDQSGFPPAPSLSRRGEWRARQPGGAGEALLAGSAREAA